MPAVTLYGTTPIAPNTTSDVPLPKFAHHHAKPRTGNITDHNTGISLSGNVTNPVFDALVSTENRKAEQKGKEWNHLANRLKIKQSMSNNAAAEAIHVHSSRIGNPNRVDAMKAYLHTNGTIRRNFGKSKNPAGAVIAVCWISRKRSAGGCLRLKSNLAENAIS
jgi:hypothetical protein